MKLKIQYIGLGKMGLNMIERLLEKGYEVSAFDVSEEAKKKAQIVGAQVFDSVEKLVRSEESPRLIWIMVPHKFVDDVLEKITPILDHGDTVIDGGNSPYKESIRRAKELKEKKINFLDVGVSGGPGGARNGASLMVGGKKEDYEKYEELFKDLSVPEGYGHMGDHGAGHFVKMVHNGIEYGMMQAIAEGFAIMKESPLHLNLTKIAEVYDRGTVIESRLISWLGKAFREEGEDLKKISGKISHSGEGLWTVETAKELGISVPVINDALQFRIDSQEGPSYTGQIVSALRNQFGGHEVKEK